MLLVYIAIVGITKKSKSCLGVQRAITNSRFSRHLHRTGRTRASLFFYLSLPMKQPRFAYEHQQEREGEKWGKKHTLSHSNKSDLQQEKG